jgi:hypothetical protein
MWRLFLEPKTSPKGFLGEPEPGKPTVAKFSWNRYEPDFKGELKGFKVSCNFINSTRIANKVYFRSNIGTSQVNEPNRFGKSRYSIRTPIRERFTI